ncbi:MAG: hypothetical protein RBQ99_04495 [Trichlorobacter sp.]|nr:hypothetical protein [Trichlorobacter sp.]
MSSVIRISIPTAVAAFIQKGTPLAKRLRGAEGATDLPPLQLILLLFCLTKDKEPAVVASAFDTLARLPDEKYATLCDQPDLHPSILHTVAQAAGHRSFVRNLLLAHSSLAPATGVLLEAAQQSADSNLQCKDEQAQEDGLERLSKYQQSLELAVSEKIKLALTGDKEWRKILVRDSNRLVSSSVLKNPRLTEPEVLTILKSGVQHDEIIRIICSNKEWVKNYQIRKALLENPKTPLPNALRFLGTMHEKDISSYAKSRNISSVIANQARRMLQKK